jgi:hypothetical protein
MIAAHDGGGQMANQRERITKDLKKVRSNKSKLGNAMGLSLTSADRYLKWLDSGDLDDDQLRTLARGLSAVGLEPLHYIKEVPPDKKVTLSTSLLPLLDIFEGDKASLEALLKILSADDSEREVLRIVAEDRLKRR